MSYSMLFTGTSGYAAHGEILSESDRFILPYHPYPMNATIAGPPAAPWESQDLSWTLKAEVASIITFATDSGDIPSPS